MINFAFLGNNRLARAASSGPVLTALPGPAPTVRYNPNFSTVTESAGKITSISDLQGLTAVTDSGLGNGPALLTNALGVKFVRNYLSYLTGGNAYVAAPRAQTLFLVGRVHRSVTAATPMIGLTSVAGGTAVNTSGVCLNSSASAPNIPFLTASGSAAFSFNDAANKKWMMPGQQLQVLGVRSGNTAQGGTRFAINQRTAVAAQSSSAATGLAGFEIGRNPISTALTGNFDWYEIVMYNTALTDAEFDAVAAALVAGYGIPPITNTLILGLDSITAGIGDIVPGSSLGMQLTDPGGPNAMPANWRVLNTAISGNTVATAQGRRDATHNPFDSTTDIGGRRVVAIQGAGNDIDAPVNGSAADAYAALVGYYQTTTTGILNRGWEVYHSLNIAYDDATVQGKIDTLRGLLTAPQFLTDTLTNTGQAYDGKMRIVNLPAVTAPGGATIFNVRTDTDNLTYYQTDGIHPSIAGTGEIAKAYKAAIAP